MVSGIGISFYFGLGDGFDVPEARRARTPTPPPEPQRPVYRRRPTQECIARSPDDSGGRWKMDGREYRRDAEGRVWVKKLPQPTIQQPQPSPPQWKTPPSPQKQPAQLPPAGQREGTPTSSGTSSTDSSPKVPQTEIF